MPFQSLRLIPGLDVERTPSLNEAGFSATAFIRWRDALPEKLGGWQRYYPYTIGSRVQALNAWTSLNAVPYLGVGAQSSLSVIASGVQTNLTPQIFTSNVTPNFSVALGSNVVTIADSNINSVTTYDTIYLATPVAVGGLILFGTYVIQEILSSTSYTINAAANATSLATSAGAVPTFTTTAQSYSVTVTLTAHGLIAGDTVNFPVSTTVGGVTISGTYTVQSITSADAFVISASNSATSSARPNRYEFR